MNHLQRSCKKCVANIPTRFQHSASAVKSTATSTDDKEKLACVLTNTILYDGQPPVLGSKKANLPTGDSTSLVENMKQTILKTNLPKHGDGVSNPEKALEVVSFKNKLSAQMLQSLVKNLWTSDYAKNSGLKDTTLSSRQDFVFQFNKNIPKSRNGHLISGRVLLPAFADQDFVESTQSQEAVWSNLVSTSPEFKEIPTKFQTNHEVHDGTPFPCPQKLLSVNNFRWSSRLNQGIFQNFANAMSYAINNGAEMGKDLKEPIPMQFVSFNGTSFYFMWYQLNTLKFNGLQNDNSVKNIAWAVEAKLCDSITAEIPDTEYCVTYSDQSIKRKTIEGLKGVIVDGFNEDAAQLFSEFMLYPTRTN